MGQSIAIEGLSLTDPKVNYLVLEKDCGFDIHGYAKKQDVVNAVKYFWATSPEKKDMDFEMFARRFTVFKTTRSFGIVPDVNVNFSF